MTAHEDADEALRRDFAMLRARDGRAVPAFDDVVARAHARGARRADGSARRVPLIAAAVLLLAASLIVSRAREGRHRRAAAPGSPQTISWASPTASLLRTPHSDLLRTTPDLSASIVDRVIPSYHAKESGS